MWHFIKESSDILLNIAEMAFISLFTGARKNLDLEASMHKLSQFLFCEIYVSKKLYGTTLQGSINESTSFAAEWSRILSPSGLVRDLEQDSHSSLSQNIFLNMGASFFEI